MANVLEIHTEVIDHFGGSTGVRELALLEAAVATPQASFGGESIYSGLVEIAAAYLFFLCRNHPFVDGNKRAALGAALIFLRLNGAEPMPDSEAWENLPMDVAASKVNREEATRRLGELVEGTQR